MRARDWSTLGLERTDDVTAIRRAYARRLKATDVDADPAAFIALREALERALAYAAGRQRGDRDEPADLPSPDMAAAGYSLAEPVFAGPPAAAVEPAAGEPAAGEDPDERFAALEALLFTPAADGGDDYRFPDEAELVAAMRAVLDHPGMVSVDRGARIEAWLAQLLFDAVPRSDPVIGLAIDRFGWENRAGTWDQPWLLEELVSRRRAFRLADEVAAPGHPLHKAWRDLTGDAESLGLRSIARGDEVGRLLGHIREQCPAAEERLNPYRVALWDERLNRSVESRLKWAGLAFLGIFFLTRIVSAMMPDAPAAPASSPVPFAIDQGPTVAAAPPPAYTDPETDLAPFVDDASRGRFDLAALQAGNPRLHERLIERWREASAGTGRDWRFAGDIRRILDEAASEGLRGGDYDLQAAYWRLAADRLSWLRERSIEDCDRLIGGATVARAFPVAFAERLRTLRARALEAGAPPTRQAGRTEFAVPGSIFAAAMRRSGLDRPTLGAALNGGGTPAQRCGARIALIEAALAAPRAEAAPMLRAMSATIQAAGAPRQQDRLRS